MLQTATVLEITRLLELFPVEKLRRNWPDLSGKKEEICASVAQLERQSILAFVVDNVRFCKQHCYVFDRPRPAMRAFPDNILSGEKVVELEGVQAHFLIRLVHSVILHEPLEETTESFLWPMWVDVTPRYVVVRFVVVEKNLKTYLDRAYSLGRKNVNEKAILDQLVSHFDMNAADLHERVKELWAEDFMDAYEIKFKRPRSTATETMDEQLGIKQHHRDLYDYVQTATLFRTTFKTFPGVVGRSMPFHVDPARGTIDFPCYSDHERGSDFVVNEVLRQDE